eukprot:TRINITY_DN4557_c0_g1_i3.p1 TRINITY_DN4557_c0_g1~~TRINITY_DN4557_c0_g1_i3.p1  ORF type:complete len:154 (+),score=63.94 TRINITY_DN4557_c0_g1_i3:146-607(+)
MNWITFKLTCCNLSSRKWINSNPHNNYPILSSSRSNPLMKSTPIEKCNSLLLLNRSMESKRSFFKKKEERITLLELNPLPSSSDSSPFHPTIPIVTLDSSKDRDWKQTKEEWNQMNERIIKLEQSLIELEKRRGDLLLSLFHFLPLSSFIFKH